VRKNIVALVTVGTLGLSGLALAGPAMAAVGASPQATATAGAPADRIKSALSGLVSDKTLTQAQADKVADTLASAGVGPGGHGGPGGRGGPGGFGADPTALAKALGMTQAELRTAVESGKTLAQVAKDKGVSVDTLVAALVKSAKEQIAKEVTAGRLTQAQADARVADLTARITEHVNSTRPGRPGARS
jgi:hypothetical protein